MRRKKYMYQHCCCRSSTIDRRGKEEKLDFPVQKWGDENKRLHGINRWSFPLRFAYWQTSNGGEREEEGAYICVCRANENFLSTCTFSFSDCEWWVRAYGSSEGRIRWRWVADFVPQKCYSSLNTTALPNSLSPISFDIVIKWTVYNVCAETSLSLSLSLLIEHVTQLWQLIWHTCCPRKMKGREK